MAVRNSSMKSVASNTQTQIYAVASGAVTKLQYMVLDSDGTGDAVQYSSMLEAYCSLLGDRGIGEELQAEMRDAGVNAHDDIQASDFISENRDLVEELLEKYGYRVITVLKWRK